jgi:PKD repeat protein
VQVANQPPHSVRIIEIVDSSITPNRPSISVSVPDSAEVGKPIKLSCTSSAAGDPVVAIHWDFGDGTSADETPASHTYTRAGTYSLRVWAEGADGLKAQSSTSLNVSGAVDTEFKFQQNRRFVDVNGE